MTQAAFSAKRGLLCLSNSENGLPKRCKVIVKTGVPFFEIAQSAEDNRVELIILGRHDLPNGSNFGESHTLHRVIRHAKCPVLMVNESGRDFVASPDGD